LATEQRRARYLPQECRPVLPEIGFVRLPLVIAPLGPIPVSKSTWWAGVRSGRYPKPVKFGPRITAWRVEDIRELIASGGVS
jgi:prophage regulatory protein